MGRTRKPAWRNSGVRVMIGKNVGKRKEPPWGKTDAPEINRGKRILTPGRKNLKPITFRTDIDVDLLSSDEDGGDDVVILDSKREQCELVEDVSPTSDSAEKLSSLESDMIYVQGYKVKRSNATILETIFKKHGDIAAECVFKTDSMRSSILEIICEVVRQVQTNDVIVKMEEIERRVSDAEAVNIDVSWLRAHLEVINKRNEYSLLMEMKSNTILVKRAAQMDVRESCVELMAAQERFEKAERCARVLHLVEKNLNGSILECKGKLDSWVKHQVV